MKPLILIACFSPIVIIWIAMKIGIFIFTATDEHKYVSRELTKSHGPYLADAYADVDEMEDEYGDRTDYR